MAELSKYIQKSPIAHTENNPILVQKDLLKKQTAYTELYMRDIIEYIHEWELVVTTRVDASHKQVKDLKQDLDHYEKKFGKLAGSHEAAIEKGKTPDTKESDRLKRNEEKLSLAKDTYETHASNLCNLLEEVVDCAWKDILPLLLRMTKMDRDHVEGQFSILDSSVVIQNLKDLAEEYKIDLTTPPPVAATGKNKKTEANKKDKKVSPLKQ